MANERYLLDSNICIYILAGVNLALRRRIQLCDDGEIAVSAIAYAEVMRGIAADDDERNRRAARLFKGFEVLSFDREAAERYRLLPFRRGSFDRLIAAHALSMNLTLVTANARDFTDVPGLRVENWAS